MLIILLTVACTADSVRGGDSIVDGPTDTGPESYPSAYISGKYRANTLSIVEDAEQGGDVNGDGTIDNKLPAVLALVDAFVEQPLKAEDINATLAEDMGDGTIIVLSEVAYAEGELTLSIVLGLQDEEGELSVDPESLDGGQPRSSFAGIFLDESGYRIGSERVELPFPIVADEPPVPVPLEQVTLEGEVTDQALTGLMYGAIPVDDMVDQVLDVITPTGEDYDPEKYLDKDREEFLEFIRDFANQDSVSDIELADGRRAVSAALRFEATPAEF